MASTSIGLLVSKATERMWTRSSLASWRLKARTERPVLLLIPAALPVDLEKLGGRGYWAGVRGGITICPHVTSILGGRRGL